MKKNRLLLLLGSMFIIILALVVPELMVGCTTTPTAKPTSAERQVINLRIISEFPEAAAVEVKQARYVFAEEISKQVLENTKDYKVEWSYLFGGAVAKPGEALDAMSRGLGDVGCVVTVFQQTKLQLQQFTQWAPFGPEDIGEMYNAMYKTCEQNPILTDMFEEKYNQKVLGWISDGNFQLITSFPIRTMEDLKGHKVGHGGPMVPWLSALGATGVQTTLMEAYTSIETGVYDGWAMFLNGVVGYKLFEVAPYYTIVNFGSPVVAVMTVNLNTFNSLPAEVQEIMLKVGNESAARGAEYVKTSETQLMQVLKDGGTNIYTLPVEERARWAKTLDDAGIAAKYVSDANAAGLPGSNVLRSYIHNCETEGYQWPVVPKFD